MLELGRRVLDRGDEVEVVLELGDRRHEDVEPSVARLDGERGARTGAGLRTRVATRCRVRGAASRVLAAQERLALRMRLRQLAALGERIGRDDVRIARPARCTAATAAAAGSPSASRPASGTAARRARTTAPLIQRRASPRLRVPALHGQHVADRLAEPALEHAREPRARHRVVELVRRRDRRSPAAGAPAPRKYHGSSYAAATALGVDARAAARRPRRNSRAVSAVTP